MAQPQTATAPEPYTPEMSHSSNSLPVSKLANATTSESSIEAENRHQKGTIWQFGGHVSWHIKDERQWFSEISQ